VEKEMKRRALGLHEIPERYAMSYSYWRQQVRERRLSARLAGNRLVVMVEDVETFIDKNWPARDAASPAQTLTKKGRP
jgi:hypothetical protein